jgi:hypothetical protein
MLKIGSRKIGFVIGRAWPLDALVRGVPIIQSIGRLKAKHGRPIAHTRVSGVSDPTYREETLGL